MANKRSRLVMQRLAKLELESNKREIGFVFCKDKLLQTSVV